MPRRSEIKRRNMLKQKNAKFEDKKQNKTFTFKPKKQSTK